MTEPESHTLAYLRRIDEKLDRLGSELGGRLDRIEGRLERIEDELLVLNGIALRLEGREIETTGVKAIFDRHERALGCWGAAPPSWKVPINPEQQDMNGGRPLPPSRPSAIMPAPSGSPPPVRALQLPGLPGRSPAMTPHCAAK